MVEEGNLGYVGVGSMRFMGICLVDVVAQDGSLGVVGDGGSNDLKERHRSDFSKQI